MIRYKVMLMFKTFLIITTLCFGTLSEAGKTSMWDDDKASEDFIICLTKSMTDNPNFKNYASSLEEVKIDLLKAVKAMKKGFARDNIMKGAVKSALEGLIAKDENRDEKILIINNIMQECYRVVFFDKFKPRVAKKGNQFDTQQPKDKTKSDEIPQAGQNPNYPPQSRNQWNTFSPNEQKPLQYNNVPKNQQKNRWNGFRQQTQGQNILPQPQGQNIPQQPNLSKDSANTYAFSTANTYATPYGTFQQQPTSSNNSYLWNAQQNQPLNQFKTNNQQYNSQGNEGNQFNTQQPKDKTKSDVIPRAGQNPNYPPQSRNQWNSFLPNEQQPPQYNNVPQNQEKNRWNGFRQQPQGQNILQQPQGQNILQQPQGQNIPQQPNLSQDSANTYAFSTANTYATPYRTFQQQPPLSNNSYLWNAQQNKPLNQFKTYNQQYNSQGNGNAYQNPVNQPSWWRTGSDATYDSYKQNESQNNKEYNPPSPSSSQTTYIEPKQNYNYRVSSPVTNDDRSNAVSSSSSKSYSIDNSKQKLLIPDNKPQTDTKQQNLPSFNEDKAVKALKFSETLYTIFDNDDLFHKLFQLYTSKEQSKTLVYYMLFNGLGSCGYDEKIKKELATNSISFMDAMPEGSSTQNYAEAICKMLMVQFNSFDLIGNNPDDQGKTLANACLAALKKLKGPPAYTDSDNKPSAPLASQQNLPGYPTQNINYDDSYPNYKTAQVKSVSFSKNQQNQQTNLPNKGSDYSVPQKLPIQKQQNVYGINNQAKDDKTISYKENKINKTDKNVNQSYVDDKTVNSDSASAYNNQPPSNNYDNFVYDYYYDYYFNYADAQAGNTDIKPTTYSDLTKKQQNLTNDDINDKSSNSKTISKSKDVEQSNDKSNPQYLSDNDSDGRQKSPKKLLPPIPDGQQNSKSPDTPQKPTNTAPVNTENSKDNDFMQEPYQQTVLSTDAPILQPDKLDNAQNIDLKKANSTVLKEMEKILKKYGKECNANGKFDYTRYGSVIAALIKYCQKEKYWDAKECERKVLITAIYCMAELYTEKNKNEDDNIKEPQKSIDPVQLPPNSQQNYPNIPQNDQNFNYQTGQTSKNSQAVAQDKKTDEYFVSKQNIVYPPQNQDIQQMYWENNQQFYPVKQSTLIIQPEPVNTNSVSQQMIPTEPKNAVQDNQARQNNLSQMNYNNANFQQLGQQNLNSLPINTNQGNWNLNNNIFSIPQTVNSNARVPNTNNFQYPLGNQAILPKVNNPSFSQNSNAGSWNVVSSAQSENKGFTGDQRNWNSITNGPNNPVLAQNMNRFTAGQDNLTPVSNYPSNPYLQNRKQGNYAAPPGNFNQFVY